MQHSGSPGVSPAAPDRQGPILAKPPSRIEHFWLCGPCSKSLTLVYDVEVGVRVAAKGTGRPRAAAS